MATLGLLVVYSLLFLVGRQLPCKDKSLFLGYNDCYRMNLPKIKKFYRSAEALARNERGLESLSLRAMEKAEEQKNKLKDFWQDLMALIRLVRAWAKKEYRVIPWTSLVAAVGALAYFLNPFDLIPDFLFFGYADDAFIVAWVLSSLRADLSVFLQWEVMKNEGEL